MEVTANSILSLSGAESRLKHARATPAETLRRRKNRRKSEKLCRSCEGCYTTAESGVCGRCCRDGGGYGQGARHWGLPTLIGPGPGRIDVYRERARLGEHLFHPLDVGIED